MLGKARGLGLVAAIAVAKLGLHLATSSGYGIFRDELYYLACAKRLAWGYVDHPPFSIVLLAGQTALLGDSLPALRLLPALAGAGVVFGAGWLARELGGGRGAQCLAALAALASPYLLATSHFYSMNILSVLFWTGLAGIAVRALQRDAPRLWLAFGLLAGFALLNKWLVGAFGLGLVVGLLLTPERRHLATPWMWAGGALAALLFAPHLAWQIANGWPTLEFSAAAAAEKIAPLTPFELFVEQILLAHPLTFPLWLVGVLALGLSPALQRVRALGWAVVVAFTVFAATSGKAYYLAAVYPLLFAAGSVWLEALVRRRGWRWPIPAYGALLVFGGAALAPIAMPLLPPATIADWLERTGLEADSGEVHEQGALPQQFADMFGWQALAETLAIAADALPQAERARLAIVTENYGQAGAVDYFGPALGLPPAISGHNSYHLWGSRGWDGGTALVVGRSAAEIGEWCSEVEQVAATDCGYCMPFENQKPIWLCRGLRRPLDELWVALRRYM
jgi:hypothetical protein